MTHRERLLIALNRKVPDRVPWLFAGFSPSLLEVFKEKTGSDNLEEYFDFDFRNVGPKPTKKKTDWSKYHKDLPKGTYFDEGGVAHVPSHHFIRIVSPLSNVTSLKDIEEYPFHDIMEGYRWVEIEEEVKKIHDRGYAVMGGCGGFFESTWSLRGHENTLLDFVSDSEIVRYIIDKITELVCFTAKKLANAEVDIIGFGDDIGMQDRMMISPEMWRKWIKPRFAKAIKIAKDIKPDVLIFYHSDGYIEPVIPDLIDIGVDILNPVQPECMAPEKLKREYGEKLSFWGTVGTQTTMSFATPDEVKMVVKRMIELVGYGGGLVISPTHTLQPEVPWENVVAFIEAVREYGRYGE